MFLIREANPSDLDQLTAVARHLDTVNLPNDPQVLARLLDLSRRSFDASVPVFEREYIFVLEDVAAQRLVGTSMVHAQHGTRKAPHIFFEVLVDERYSETLDRHFVHQCLRIGYNYSGPTEIGGLILVPEYRGRDEVLSELLPPLEPDGTSRLWEHLGRHFTGLTYQEADRLSKDNKEFIRTLFPQGLIYKALLPDDVQEAIGVVGAQTRGVEKMLRAIGLTYAERIDPFDGGPHFHARTDEVTLVKATRRGRVVAGEAEDGKPAIVSVERGEAPHFLAVSTRASGTGEVALPESARRALGVSAGDEVGFVYL